MRSQPTEVVAAPLHWLDAGDLALERCRRAGCQPAGHHRISLFAWWRPISAAPFMRWVMAAATGAVAAALYVADSSAKFGAAMRALLAVCSGCHHRRGIAVVVMGMITGQVFVVSGVWAVARRTQAIANATAAPSAARPGSGVRMVRSVASMQRRGIEGIRNSPGQVFRIRRTRPRRHAAQVRLATQQVRDIPPCVAAQRLRAANHRLLPVRGRDRQWVRALAGPAHSQCG